MPFFKKMPDMSKVLKGSLCRFLGILTLGVFGGMGGYWRPDGRISRLEFWRDYFLPGLFLAMLGALAYRLMYSFGALDPFSFWVRRALFALLVSPGGYFFALGDIKRFRAMRLWPGIALLNFYPVYGPALTTLVVGVFRGRRRR